ncbi:MAG TPA: hypothetical protein PLC80_14965 [Draconibacterium sp.]|nr:hypothetical protein [Draconibacterium sp.]
MEISQITAQLAMLTGHLHSSGSDDEKDIEKLQSAIAGAILNQDPSTIKSKEFVFEKSDLFLSTNIESNRLKKISELAKLVEKGDQLSETNVFVRNVPIRSTQITGSITSASAGVRVNTVGPVFDKLKKPTWYDFVTIKKLIPLYIQGQNLPVIMFDATFSQSKFFTVNAKPVELTKTYNIIPETVWIHGKVFSADVPDEYYCGLRVKSGTIVLDADPFMLNNRVTISNATKITVNLNLEQNDVFDNDPTSPYGVDARNASFNLPATFQFTFKNNVKNIVALGNAKWNVYGQNNTFVYQNAQNCVYNAFIGRVAIPVHCNQSDFTVSDCKSPFFNLSGSTKIKNSWWALSVTKLDIANPFEADGNGAIIVEGEKGLHAKWSNLQNKSISFTNPFILGEPGRISITDIKTDGSGALQTFDGWKDEQNAFGTTFECKFNKDSLLIFNTVAKGDELIFGLSDWDIKTDRPVKVNGEAVTVKTKNSAFIIAISKIKTLLIVIDENMIWDNKLPADKIPKVKPYALAMHNALFTVTPPNSLVLFAETTPELKALTHGQMYLGFGLYSYLPTLPDPYAANLGVLQRQFEISTSVPGAVAGIPKRGSVVWMWLIGLVKWEPKEDTFKVGVSFHFAPLTTQLQIEKETEAEPAGSQNFGKVNPDVFSRFSDTSNITGAAVITSDTNLTGARLSARNPLAGLNLTDFALIDVSSKANQMGVSYAKQNNFLQATVARQFKIDITGETNASVFPIQVSGLDVITAGMNAQAFTVPSIAWEPVFNLTKPELEKGDVDNNNVPLPPPYDPPVGFNYYQNDGVATRIGNLSNKQVTLSPIPMSKFLVETYKTKEDGKTFALFNLPFGMLALTILDNKSTQKKLPNIDNPKPIFENYINGGLQLELTAGTSFAPDDEGNMFEGFTIQLVNINDVSGNATDASTLAGTPTQIFNNEFATNSSNLPARPGVPVTGIGLSGYGASMFSEWLNKEALFAQTSQAQFNVVTGRTNHEVVQVKSMLYPWGIRVVRTITLFRLANGYVARIDSGWQAESDGKYDFSYNEPILGPDGKTVIGKTPKPNPFEFHPGIVKGLFNIRNIKEQPKIFSSGNAKLYAATFDADVELENVSEGGQNNRVPSKGILSYVQISPAGEPIKKAQLSELLKSENNTIGGPVNCILKIAGSRQRMKISRFDLSATVDAGNKEIFVGAARGSVIMPKDGSWTMVQHNRGTGDVSPLPEQLSVPLIRAGKWVKDKVVSDADISNFLRIAHPEDLLKLPDSDTINFGFLQNMGTQKVLFMTPGFKKGVESLLSKTPPLLADSYRLLNSKGIFPNIGDAQNNFGQAISLLKGIGGGNNPLDAFNKINLPDAGDVLNILQLKAKEEAGKLMDQGYELAKGAVNGIADKAIKFDLPSFDYPLIDYPGKLVIAIQYKASSKPKGQSQKNYVGKFDFDVDSFAGDLADTWKGRMNNLAMVVSIGPLTEVMTIKGNFNSQKGKEVDLGSSNSSDAPGLNLPTPEIEFSDALEPVIKILEILASLSSGEYGEALKKGLKIAMSNSANIWEYKFEANKDIPLVRFPPTKELYESPQTPLKLEASLGIGVYFNAALKVTTDPGQLLPTAGGYFNFHGGLQVMCVSVGVGTIFAVGNVDLKLEADTSPKVGVTLKFGFGAQITVGLPVIGHASILFMVGVEIYADSGSVVKITAFMLFKGNAELLGGLVSVTITIEAKGTVEKSGAGAPANCIAQVTFALDISIFLIIDISFSESWEESRQIA